MKSKAPLTCMEQIIMLTVFALAAALCVQVFAAAGNLSRRSDERARAMVAAQNQTELLQQLRGDGAAAGGTWNGSAWVWSYDADWQPLPGADADAAFTLVASAPATAQAYLGCAEVCVYDREARTLCTLSAAWQEVD